MKKPSKLLKKTPNNRGRPTLFNDKTVQKLKSAFRLGATDEIACRYAKIGVSTYYEWRKLNPNLAEEINTYRDIVRHNSVKTINKAIKNYDKNDELAVKSAQWWLERKYPQEFGTVGGSNIHIDQRSQVNYIEFVKDEDNTRS